MKDMMEVPRRSGHRFILTGLACGVAMWGMFASNIVWAGGLFKDTAAIKRGAEVYQQNCATCHGFKGRGEGPVARSYSPPPTDFTRGEFRHGSDNDDILVRTITFGVPGTGMSGWKGKLSDADIGAVAAYVRSLKK